MWYNVFMGTKWSPDKLKNHKGMKGKTHSPAARASVSRAQSGREHQPHEGFQAGHGSFPGTEATQFKKGFTPWNKGTAKGTNRLFVNFQAYKSNAKKRGLAFELTRDTFIEFATGICFYCGKPACGVDRVNNALGYVRGNMVSCCKICNHMKHTMTLDDFVSKCREIVAQVERLHLHIPTPHNP
jgi:hypothetical protein